MWIDEVGLSEVTHIIESMEKCAGLIKWVVWSTLSKCIALYQSHAFHADLIMWVIFYKPTFSKNEAHYELLNLVY